MSSRFALVLLCFLLSGFAALLYQTAWTRAFSFVFGTSELAVAVVLAGYMGGLAAGSAIAARLAPRIRRPVLAYGLLELFIAVSALALPFGMEALTSAYVALFQHESPTEPGMAASLFRLAGAFLLMLVPTGLMGATLPLLARDAVQRDEQIGPRIGALYAINTAGAIGGTVCAAFVLLPAFGLQRTVLVGALLNGLVFVAAALLARDGQLPPVPEAARATRVRRWVLPLMLLSGAVSFSYEVLWTRLLSQLLGGSLYAFATMLSSFLLGIALGSAAGGAVAKRARSAAVGLAVSELGVASFAILAFLLADHLPALGSALGAGWSAGPLVNAPLAALVLLPVAICLGATFPFAVRLLTADPADTASATAQVYAWNTVGAIVGAVGTGFVLLPALHFAGTAVLGALVSLGIAAAVAWLSRPRLPGALVAAFAGAVLLLLLPIDNPWRLLLSTPLSSQQVEGEVRYQAAGRSATVVLVDHPLGFRLLTNGLPEATIPSYAATPRVGREGRTLALLPVMLRPDTESTLVIGLGGGLALEGVPPSVREVDAVELEPEVLAANRVASEERLHDPLADPRMRIVLNDARGALMLAQRRYDAIVSQPSHPWTAGASHLYTREFFSLVRDRLSEDGIFVQWIGLAFVDEALLKSLLAALTDVFPEVMTFRPRGSALLFAASSQPMDFAGAERAIASAPALFARSGFAERADLTASLMLDSEGARALAAGAPPNRDDHNLLELRSARLGQGAMTLRDFGELMAPHDPIHADPPSLASVDVVRALLRRDEAERAATVTEALAGADRELALAYSARGQPAQAEAHLTRALAVDPTRARDVEAARLALELGTARPDPSMPIVALVQRALAFEQAGEWPALAELDGALSRVVVRDPLFDLALRLRTRWRVASASPARATEAIALLDRRNARRRRAAISIQRARVAHLAGRHREAWAGLHATIRGLRHPEQQPALLRRMRALADVLPDDPLKPLVLEQLAVGGDEASPR